MIRQSRLKEPKQNTFSANTSAWASWLAGTKNFLMFVEWPSFPPLNLRNLWCGSAMQTR
jgi:hypothetical protein